MRIRTLLILTVILTQIPGVYAEGEYTHVLTLESPNPETVAWYGYKVKINGNVIAITEPYADVDDIPDAGKVYIYDVDGTLLSTLQSPEPGNVNNFGRRLDLFGDTIIVNELFAIVDNLVDAGKAHLFTTDGTYQITLQSPEPSQGGGFGIAAGIYEDIIVINEYKGESRVYIFDNEGEYLKTLHSPMPMVGGKFGKIIEVSETLILLGECGTSDNPMGPGSVHLFNHDGEHLMTLQAPEPENLARFGASIDTSGDLIVIGEDYATVDEVYRAGRVYIFNTDGEYLQTLQSPIPKMNGQFGHSVAIDGDRVVVGERFANLEPFQYEGRAYVFDVDGNLLQNLTSPEPCARAAFGQDVDIDGDYIVVCEGWADIEEIDQAGRAHIFKLGEAVFELTHLVIEPVSVNVGESVTVSVDVANVGTLSGVHIVKLMIGGGLVEEKTVMVDVGVSETVSFTYETDVEGSYRVEVGELEDSYEVKKPIIPGFPAVALVLGLSLIMLFLSQRKR